MVAERWRRAFGKGSKRRRRRVVARDVASFDVSRERLVFCLRPAVRPCAERTVASCSIGGFDRGSSSVSSARHLVSLHRGIRSNASNRARDSAADRLSASGETLSTGRVRPDASSALAMHGHRWFLRRFGFPTAGEGNFPRGRGGAFSSLSTTRARAQNARAPRSIPDASVASFDAGDDAVRLGGARRDTRLGACAAPRSTARDRDEFFPYRPAQKADGARVGFQRLPMPRQPPLPRSLRDPPPVDL